MDYLPIAGKVHDILQILTAKADMESYLAVNRRKYGILPKRAGQVWKLIGATDLAIPQELLPLFSLRKGQGGQIRRNAGGRGNPSFLVRLAGELHWYTSPTLKEFLTLNGQAPEDILRGALNYYGKSGDTPQKLTDLLDHQGAAAEYIAERDISPEEKNALYYLYMNPDYFCKQLKRVFAQAYNLLKGLYTQYEDFIQGKEEQYTESQELIEQAIEQIVDGGNTSLRREMAYSISLVDGFGCIPFRETGLSGLVLGAEWMDADSIKAAGIVDLCWALTDEKRLSMIEVVRENGDMTISQLAKALGVQSNTLLYHLDFLVSAGIFSLNKGAGISSKKKIYSLNRDIFNAAADFFKELGSVEPSQNG